MGSLYSKLCSKLCSDSSTHEGGHTVLSNTVGEGDAVSTKPSNPRAAAAEAAERRVKEQQGRGTKGGKLAKQLLAKQSSRPGPESREEERPVWD